MHDGYDGLEVTVITPGIPNMETMLAIRVEGTIVVFDYLCVCRRGTVNFGSSFAIYAVLNLDFGLNRV